MAKVWAICFKIMKLVSSSRNWGQKGAALYPAAEEVEEVRRFETACRTSSKPLLLERKARAPRRRQASFKGPAPALEKMIEIVGSCRCWNSLEDRKGEFLAQVQIEHRNRWMMRFEERQAGREVLRLQDLLNPAEVRQFQHHPRTHRRGVLDNEDLGSKCVVCGVIQHTGGSPHRLQ